MHCYINSLLLALTIFLSAIRFAFKKITVALLPSNISVPEIQCNVLTDALKGIQTEVLQLLFSYDPRHIRISPKQQKN